MRKIPEELTENEYEREMKERAAKKRNIIVRETRVLRIGLAKEVEGIIEKWLGITAYTRRVISIGGELVVEVEYINNKIAIMKKIWLLNGTGLWIDDDYSTREREIQDWLAAIEEEETSSGLNVKTGYLKINVDGI